MSDTPDIETLIDYLTNSTRLSRDEARRVVQDITAFFAETPEAYITRRHREMQQRDGASNEVIYTQILVELSQRTFAAPPLTKRQIRRIIYG
ncbi:MAG: hypothetical protein AAF512_02745 [Pseudomonadota bacterium]